jgi:putative phosphoesterase
MKLMIASDIHGSAYYCEEMMRAFEREKPEKLLLLGDLLYHGPRNELPRDYQPKRVIDMLNGIAGHLLCVRGNCEAEVDQMVLQFPIMADYCVLYLDGHMVFATHGHHFNKDNAPPLQKRDILLYGHTHVPLYETTESCVIMNPGSVSIPKESSPHSYMMAEGGLYLWKDLDGGCYAEHALSAV